ncbi:uncharacterized protein J4E79_003699 [Alternaria viburni]|uniref:uncharacterized protein n=1 Tax=Alternaria viburni TaxID=566460 RepID=UPI0020C39E56|nr:uncharacterized protein J4E79_003699 [Alternaria viburni]KAI4664197.1 hypothetical protein J4E79_003699 [Alternaria viburni]
MAVGLGETITVINKSGKVVSSSKHIVNVFKEAKAAYRERKAEIKAERDAAVKEKELAKGVKAIRLDDDDARSQVSHRSKASKAHTHRTKAHDRPVMERGYSDSFYANDSPRSSKHRFEADLAGDAHNKEIARRNSDQAVQRSSQSSKSRSKSVDMDLCYGDVPPPLPDKKYNDVELKEKASKIELLLDEANCLQHTATAMIENLQKNPEALAAVSLTLAEISAIVGKMGPGVLMTLKGSFPAVAALLLSPQFMIAGGVAVGVTIVALGGYKIIKKMQVQKEVDAPLPEPQMAIPMRAATMPIEDSNNQLDELEPQELSRVELWRRGIADVEANSSGTSVDGEFITPEASRTLCAAGVLDEDDLKSRRSTRSKKHSSESKHKEHKEHKHRAPKSEVSVKTSKTSDSKRPSSKVASSKVASSKVASSKSGKESSKESSKTKKKEKEPSGLKMLFRAHTVAV